MQNSGRFLIARRHARNPIGWIFALAGVDGLVGEVAKRAMAGQYANTVAFTAGPPVMVDAVLRHLLHEARMPRTFVRYDKFA